ncbi:DUF4367 domain-containing protein [Brevibacillus fluminis]|uniref:DUF4367 domain-containing protein n=1 Tax=Brevibacillus fluminis TaxID=511487 RepID=UPI003F88FDAB
MEERIKNAMDTLQKKNEQFQLSPSLRDRILSSAQKVKQAEHVGKHGRKTRGLLVAALLFVFSTGFASITWYEIRNKEGQIVQEYQAAPSLSKDKLLEMQRMQKSFEQIQSRLEPGTAAAVYQIKEDGQEDFSFLDRPLILTKLVDLRALTKDLPQYPDQIAGGYTFVEASLSYEYEKDEALHEQLKQTARETNRDLIIHPIRSLPSISHVSVTYQNPSGKQFRINFLKQFWTGKSKMMVPGEHQKVEQVRIGDVEGLYTERLDPFGKPRRELRWMDEGWSLSINGTDEAITKADLLKIANQLQ